MALTKQQRKVMIAKIEKLPAQLQSAVRGANANALDTPYRAGGWTARQVIHHLADSHMNAFIRARLALTETNPTLKPYDQDSWALLEDSVKAPVQVSLLIMKGLHARFVVFFRSLPDDAWERPAFHPEYGATSIEGILKTYSGHGEAHLKQIVTALRLAAKARPAAKKPAKKAVKKVAKKRR